LSAVVDVPYALAVSAGMLAAVNPCGFALLPAYLAVLVVGSEGDSRATQIRRAVVLTAAMTLGFAAVFGVFGLLAAPVADAVARHLPWVSIGLGVILAVLGVVLIAGRQLPMLVPKLSKGPAVTRRVGSMALFGAAYAIASLGCTVGPFLAVVVAGFRAGSLLDGVSLFLAYALGMGLVVGAAALAVALARVSFVRGLRRAAPVVNRIAGGLMVLAGLYVAWYGWYEVRVLRGGDPNDTVVDAAAQVQSALATTVDRAGPGTVTIVALLLLAAALLVGGRRLRARAAQDSEPRRHSDPD
jgi:cytochrome c biogenesis protein CcdA